VEASGQSVEVEGMTRYYIENAKIQREQGIVDNAGLMRQLGATPG
jgi:predicted ester cyclase